MNGIRPSALLTIVHCPGSVQAQARYPEDPSLYNEPAEQGNAAHWVSDQCIPTQFEPVDYLGTEAPNGWMIDREITTNVVPYIESIRRLHSQCDWAATEYQLACDRIEPGMTGTADSVAVNYTKRMMYIDDLKFGFRTVEAMFNYQLITYGTGLADLLQLNGFTEQQWYMTLTIHQPRKWHEAGRERSWVVRMDELRPYVNTLQHAIAEAKKENPIVRTGRHCGFCSARLHCSAFLASGENAIDVVETLHLIEHTTSTKEAEFIELSRAKKVIEDRLTVITEHIEHRAASGERLTLTSMKPGRQRRDWKDDQTTELFLNGMGDIAKDVKWKSPAQLEKLIDPTVINNYVKKTPGKARLVPDDNSKAKEVFKS